MEQQQTVEQAIDGIITDAMSVAEEPEVKQSESPQPDTHAAPQDKNEEFRVKKHLQERDEAREEARLLKEQLEYLKGKVDVFSSVSKQQEQQDDPTEYMTDTEKALFMQQQELKKTLESMSAAVSQVATKVVTQENRQREENFFKNNPTVNRTDASELIQSFAKQNPVIGQALISGEVDLQQVYDLALLRSGKSVQPRQADPNAVFGVVNTTAPARQEVVVDTWGTADKILKDKNSTNKKDAVDSQLNELTNNFITMLRKE